MLMTNESLERFAALSSLLSQSVAVWSSRPLYLLRTFVHFGSVSKKNLSFVANFFLWLPAQGVRPSSYSPAVFLMLWLKTRTQDDQGLLPGFVTSHKRLSSRGLYSSHCTYTMEPIDSPSAPTVAKPTHYLTLTNPTAITTCSTTIPSGHR